MCGLGVRYLHTSYVYNYVKTACVLGVSQLVVCYVVEGSGFVVVVGFCFCALFARLGCGVFHFGGGCVWGVVCFILVL